MPLNEEERYRQAEYEKGYFSRPTKEQLEIALLKQQLEHAQDTIGYLDDHIDKQTKIVDEVRDAIQRYTTGKQAKGLTLDAIMNAVGWRL